MTLQILRGLRATMVLLATCGAIGAAPPPDEPASPYVESDVMIPMRDGVRLHAKILRPKEQAGDLPIILSRTPYGVAEVAENLPKYYATLANEGYLFVYQDLRGRFAFEGTFVMSRPPRAAGDPAAIDEGTDAYDTIEWLIKNSPATTAASGCVAGPTGAGRRSTPPSSPTRR